MEYSKLISISGLPGVFELISTKNNGAIVKSLEDNSTKFVSSRIHNFSQLEAIEIYTQRENVHLADIFSAMDTNEAIEIPNEKDANAVKKYFEQVYPEMDFDRVYDSDRRKMIKWYRLLKKQNIPFVAAKTTEE